MERTLTPQIALKWENAEQRRCALEILGWEKVLDAIGAETIDTDPDPEIGVLLRADLPDAPGAQFLRVRCGTGRMFMHSVPSQEEDQRIKTALDAQAFMWPVRGLNHEQIKVLITNKEKRT
jgi:hypothetical protein